MNEPGILGTNVPISTETSYNHQGRLSQVLTENFTAGAVTSRTQVSYEYNTQGIRITTLAETDADNNGSFETRHKTSYLVDHRNHTGYAQTIEETVVDADSGMFVSRKVYTFGHDEITQTEFTYDGTGNTTANITGDPTTHTFLHDGHGSVRALLNATAAIAQVFSYSAYGELLAIHNAQATLTGTTAAAALTSLLYSGEFFDANIGRQYLRARWYDPTTGRFNRLDMFAGDSSDPQSLHKYLYTHGDPVTGIDPTGRWSLGNVTIATAIRGALVGMVVGAVTGAIFGGIDGYLARGRWDDAVAGAKSGAFWGGIAGLLTGGLGAWIGPTLKTMSAIAKLRFLRSLFVINLAAAGYGVATAESFAQGFFRGTTGLIGGLSLLRAMRAIRMTQLSMPNPRTQYRSAARALDMDGRGHSHAKHGAHVTPDDHYKRLTTGVAPGGGPGGVPPASGSFATNKVHVDAYERALAKLWQDPLKKNGDFKKGVQIPFDLKGAGRSYTLDGAGNLVSTKADRVFAWFKLNDAGNDYYLFTMYPKP